MLAERSGLERVDRQMKNKPFYVEPKHDGERVQLHKDGDRWVDSSGLMDSRWTRVLVSTHGLVSI